MVSSRSRATCAGSAGGREAAGVVRTEPLEQLGVVGVLGVVAHPCLLSFDSSCPAAAPVFRSSSAELLAGPVQPDAHRVGRDVEDRRDLGRGQLLPGPQPQQLGVLLAQRAERLGEVGVVALPGTGRARRPAGRRRRCGPRAAPGGVRLASRWPGSCGPRRRPRAAAPPVGRRAGASRRAASRRARRRPSWGRYVGPGSAAGGRRAQGRAPRTAPASASADMLLTVSHVQETSGFFRGRLRMVTNAIWGARRDGVGDQSPPPPTPARWRRCRPRRRQSRRGGGGGGPPSGPASRTMHR